MDLHFSYTVWHKSLTVENFGKFDKWLAIHQYFPANLLFLCYSYEAYNQFVKVLLVKALLHVPHLSKFFPIKLLHYSYRYTLTIASLQVVRFSVLMWSVAMYSCLVILLI